MKALDQLPGAIVVVDSSENMTTGDRNGVSNEADLSAFLVKRPEIKVSMNCPR